MFEIGKIVLDITSVACILKSGTNIQIIFKSGVVKNFSEKELGLSVEHFYDEIKNYINLKQVNV